MFVTTFILWKSSCSDFGEMLGNCFTILWFLSITIKGNWLFVLLIFWTSAAVININFLITVICTTCSEKMISCKKWRLQKRSTGLHVEVTKSFNKSNINHCTLFNKEFYNMTSIQYIDIFHFTEGYPERVN